MVMDPPTWRRHAYADMHSRHARIVHYLHSYSTSVDYRDARLPHRICSTTVLLDTLCLCTRDLDVRAS
jgi:hypothetical protein